MLSSRAALPAAGVLLSRLLCQRRVNVKGPRLAHHALPSVAPGGGRRLVKRGVRAMPAAQRVQHPARPGLLIDSTGGGGRCVAPMRGYDALRACTAPRAVAGLVPAARPPAPAR